MTVKAAFKLGDVIKPAFCGDSTVIGIDHYTMKGFNGQSQAWDSYTLTSTSPKPYDRWWVVNVAGRGAYAYTAVAAIPDEGVRFLSHLSGLVALSSEGNADLSSEKGALATYEAADGETLYAEEVFDGAPRLQFVGRPFTL